MLFKSRKPKVYVGVIKEIACVINIPNKDIEILYKDFTEKIVFLHRDPKYNTYYDVFTKQPYYGPRDLSLKKGDYSLIYSAIVKKAEGASIEILKEICDEMNVNLELAKQNEATYKQYIKTKLSGKNRI